MEAGLNTKKLYRLYESWCDENHQPKDKEWAYKHIFNNEYNLASHHPKKTSAIFVKQSETVKKLSIMNFIYTIKLLQGRKKNKDKEEAEQSAKKIVSINFDLQQVLMEPSD